MNRAILLGLIVLDVLTIAVIGSLFIRGDLGHSWLIALVFCGFALGYMLSIFE